MARPKKNKTQTAVKKVEKAELAETPVTVPKAETKECIKVRILGQIRADYGAFDDGDVTELPSKIAEELIKYKLAAKVE